MKTSRFLTPSDSSIFFLLLKLQICDSRSDWILQADSVSYYNFLLLNSFSVEMF